MRREIPSAGAVRAEVERKGAETMASPWTHRLARFGFASRALVYAVIGVLAMLAALGRGGRATDSKGAIAEMAAHLGAAPSSRRSRSASSGSGCGSCCRAS